MRVDTRLILNSHALCLFCISTELHDVSEIHGIMCPEKENLL